MAKISEEERYNLKNRYRHQWRTMNHADEKRMPINESKVVDLLRNSHLYRSKLVQEVGNFEKEENDTQIEHGILTYLNEAAYGELRDLVTDVGIRDETIDFMNWSTLQKWKESNNLFESDRQMRVLQNTLFTPIDMTDYEDQFVGFRELAGGLQINNSQLLDDLREETWPQINSLIDKFTPETRPLSSTGPTQTALIEAARAIPEEEEDDEDEEEEGAGEYGEEGGEEEYGEEYGEEEEIPHAKPKDEWAQMEII